MVWEGRSREAPPYPDLRLCIRKSDGAWGKAALGHGLVDTRFCRNAHPADWPIEPPTPPSTTVKKREVSFTEGFGPSVARW